MFIKNCFLGCNGINGFYSLYEGICSEKFADRVFILKGGPGCGKSTLMKTVAEAAEKKGYDVERVWCSGDPDSLDAINVVQKKLMIADGTSPHVLEPPLPGIVGRYIDLSRYYDMKKAEEIKKDISTLSKKHRNQYARAYGLIKSAAAARASDSETFDSAEIRKMIRPMAKELALNLGENRTGRQRHVFLGAFCCKGFVSHLNEAAEMCGRIYRLEISPYAGRVFMKAFAEEVADKRTEAVISHDPIEPEIVSTIIFPGKCVITTDDLPEKNGELFNHKPLALEETRFSDKEMSGNALSSLLLEKAESYLKKAKAIHDEIEALYRPVVNFNAVEYETKKLIELL